MYKICPHCDYHSETILNIHAHIDDKHPNHGVKQYFCDHCSRGCIFKYSLKKHKEDLKATVLNCDKNEKKLIILARVNS